MVYTPTRNFFLIDEYLIDMSLTEKQVLVLSNTIMIPDAKLQQGL